MADLFKTPQKGQPRTSRSRRPARTQEEIEGLNQKVAVTAKARRPFVFDSPTAAGAETQRNIVFAATSVFGRIEYMTPLATKKYWDLHFDEWVNTLEPAKQYYSIYNADLT